MSIKGRLSQVLGDGLGTPEVVVAPTLEKTTPSVFTLTEERAKGTLQAKVLGNSPMGLEALIVINRNAHGKWRVVSSLSEKKKKILGCEYVVLFETYEQAKDMANTLCQQRMREGFR